MSEWPPEIRAAVDALESDLEWELLAAAVDGRQSFDDLRRRVDVDGDAVDAAVSNLTAGGLVSKRNAGDLSDPTAYYIELSEYGRRFVRALFETLGDIDAPQSDESN